MANADTIGLRPPIKIELHRFIALIADTNADGKPTYVANLAAIAFYQDREYRTLGEMLR